MQRETGYRQHQWLNPFRPWCFLQPILHTAPPCPHSGQITNTSICVRNTKSHAKWIIKSEPTQEWKTQSNTENSEALTYNSTQLEFLYSQPAFKHENKYLSEMQIFKSLISNDLLLRRRERMCSTKRPRWRTTRNAIRSTQGRTWVFIMSPQTGE